MYRFTWERVLGGIPPALAVKYIYLKAPVGCLQVRTDRRARDGEGKISSQYMQLLDRLHDEWLDKVPSESGKVVIDATKTEDEIFRDVCLAIGAWVQEAAKDHVRQRKKPSDEERESMLLGSADLESLNALCSEAMSVAEPSAENVENANGESAASPRGRIGKSRHERLL